MTPPPKPTVQTNTTQKQAVALLVEMGERPANVGSGDLRLVVTQLG